MAKRACFQFKDIHGFLDALFRDDVHAKRVYSLANATMGVMTSASLAIHRHGSGAGAGAREADQACGETGGPTALECRCAGVVALCALGALCGRACAERIAVAMDWTDFDPDGQATIMLSLLTRHGRATPLLWLTVDKGTLKEHRNAYEDRVLMRLAEVLPEGVRVLIVADRGFGDSEALSSPGAPAQVWLCHSLSRQYLRHRRARRDADSGRLGRGSGTCTHPARGKCDRRSDTGWVPWYVCRPRT